MRVYTYLRRLDNVDDIDVTTMAVRANGTMLYDICFRFLITFVHYGK